MKTNKKGNIILVFILMTALIVIASSFIFLISGKMRNITYELSSMRALYVAEAGLQKAMWYLVTPSSQGGQGTSWRTTGVTESYSLGQYTFSILDSGVDEAIIASTGEVLSATRFISQKVSLISFPSAFDYAIFSNSEINATGSVLITGDIFGNGDTNFGGSAQLVDGSVYHPPGYEVDGAPDGGVPDPLPTMPSLDTSSYDSEISIAEGVASGDVNYTSDIYLNGGTVYVNGDVNISGTGTIYGPGAIVATGNINISGTLTSNDSGINFISGDSMNLSGSSTIPDSTFYSSGSINVSGSGRFIGGSFLTNGDINMSGSPSIQGIVYSGGTTTITGDVSLNGSFACSTLNHLTGNVSITFDEEALPEEIPPGFASEGISPIKGSWKEL